MSKVMILAVSFVYYMERNKKLGNMKTRFSHYLLAGMAALAMMSHIETVHAQEKARMQYNVNWRESVFFFSSSEALDVTVGRRFNKRNFLGVGSGYHWVKRTDDADPTNDNGEVTALPLFTEYIGYLPIKHISRNSLFFAADLGGRYYLDKVPLKNDTDRFEPLINFKIGWDATLEGRVGLNLGLGFGLPDGFGASVGFRF